MKKRIKILMYRRHIAYLPVDLLQRFESVVPTLSINIWIRQKAQEDFGLRITKETDLDDLDRIVREWYYLDKADWLREKMRLAIQKETIHS